MALHIYARTAPATPRYNRQSHLVWRRPAHCADRRASASAEASAELDQLEDLQPSEGSGHAGQSDPAQEFTERAEGPDAKG